MKLNFDMYIKRLNYNQKIFIKNSFYFLCCIFLEYLLRNCEFRIVIMPNIIIIILNSKCYADFLYLMSYFH